VQDAAEDSKLGAGFNGSFEDNISGDLLWVHQETYFQVTLLSHY
jgi:hypothetical protein